MSHRSKRTSKWCWLGVVCWQQDRIAGSARSYRWSHVALVRPVKGRAIAFVAMESRGGGDWRDPDVAIGIVRWMAGQMTKAVTGELLARCAFRERGR
jgi:hypothetical protein